MRRNFILGPQNPDHGSHTAQGGDLGELYTYGDRHRPLPEDLVMRYPRQQALQRVSGPGISSWLMFLTQSTIVAAGLVLALDFFSGHRVSESIAQSVWNVSEATAGDQVAVIGADTDRHVTKTLLDTAVGMSAGNQFMCFLEEVGGGLLGYSANLSDKAMGDQMISNCHRRRTETHEWLQQATRGSSF